MHKEQVNKIIALVLQYGRERQKVGKRLEQGKSQKVTNHENNAADFMDDIVDELNLLIGNVDTATNTGTIDMQYEYENRNIVDCSGKPIDETVTKKKQQHIQTNPIVIIENKCAVDLNTIFDIQRYKNDIQIQYTDTAEGTHFINTVPFDENETEKCNSVFNELAKAWKSYRGMNEFRSK